MRRAVAVALLLAGCAESHTAQPPRQEAHPDCTYDAGDAGVYRLVGWSCRTPDGRGVCDEELRCQ